MRVIATAVNLGHIVSRAGRQLANAAHHLFNATPRRRQVAEKRWRYGGSIESISVVKPLKRRRTADVVRPSLASSRDAIVDSPLAAP